MQPTDERHLAELRSRYLAAVWVGHDGEALFIVAEIDELVHAEDIERAKAVKQ